MDDDERIRKQMEFILNQQAQFAADIGRLQEKDAQLQAKHEQLQDIVGRLANVTHEGFENLESKMSSLIDAQIKTEERLTALADAQAQTDDRLNTLISVVERHISDGHHHGPKA